MDVIIVTIVELLMPVNPILLYSTLNWYTPYVSGILNVNSYFPLPIFLRLPRQNGSMRTNSTCTSLALWGTHFPFSQRSNSTKYTCEQQHNFLYSIYLHIIYYRIKFKNKYYSHVHNSVRRWRWWLSQFMMSNWLHSYHTSIFQSPQNDICSNFLVSRKIIHFPILTTKLHFIIILKQLNNELFIVETHNFLYRGSKCCIWKKIQRSREHDSSIISCL